MTLKAIYLIFCLLNSKYVSLEALNPVLSWQHLPMKNPFSKQPTTLTKLNMIWAYPILGDSPEKKRRKKIDPVWEIGENRASFQWDFEVANMLAQNYNYIPWQGSIVQYEEIGLGKTDAMATPAHIAVGATEIDPLEVEKINKILPTFYQGNGLGTATLLSAKDGHFSFKYNGLIKNKFGFQNYLRYMINSCYPGAKVSLISEHWQDGTNLPSPLWHRKIPSGLTSKLRKKILWKKPYFYEHENFTNLPEPGGTDSNPQSIS